MSLRPWRLLWLCLLVGGPAPGLAAEVPRAPDAPPVLAAKERTRIIEAAIAQVRARHYSPDKAVMAEKMMRSRLKRGDYDAITDPRELARVLSEHLARDGQDAHFFVHYSAQPLPRNLPLPWEPASSEAESFLAQREERRRRMYLREAYGIGRVERLAGNVGYLRLVSMPDVKFTGEAAAAAMRLLSATDALIIDLRGNGGGDTRLSALYLGWLLPERTHVLDTLWKGRPKEPLHTPAPPPAGRYGDDKEVYVLTDGDTFSAAELLAYDLQARSRARVVGEATHGGANPGVALPMDEHFIVTVPMGQTVHAVTKTSWEGVGVKPDMSVPAADALRTAHVAALTALEKRAEEPAQLEEVRGALESLGAGTKP
ncbi:S41 family peptidase [Myxococcus sp. RHSTA-1-4]|uniref:S41 family peptidase n=1 Tax=Myxococcus sp. RHSTA-1-4 TaxID=2874601 RepID=UPI001CC0F312|nr:S41 family peptidase [Myxococcus sp. RHSTA-1-4]MBZ4418572.1 S41 family peptidase [Myxococcus sp. RHSTA-1-4]